MLKLSTDNIDAEYYRVEEVRQGLSSFRAAFPASDQIVLKPGEAYPRGDQGFLSCSLYFDGKASTISTMFAAMIKNIRLERPSGAKNATLIIRMMPTYEYSEDGKSALGCVYKWEPTKVRRGPSGTIVFGDDPEMQSFQWTWPKVNQALMGFLSTNKVVVSYSCGDDNSSLKFRLDDGKVYTATPGQWVNWNLINNPFSISNSPLYAVDGEKPDVAVPKDAKVIFQLDHATIFLDNTLLYGVARIEIVETGTAFTPYSALVLMSNTSFRKGVKSFTVVTNFNGTSVYLNSSCS